QEGERTGFEAGARFANGASLATAGALSRVANGFRLDLTNLDLVRERVLARLAQPASMSMQGDAIRIDNFELEVEGGRVRVQGRAAEQLDLVADLARLPLSTANNVAPGLALASTIDGRVTLAGSREKPDVRFALEGSGISARALAEAGIPPLSVRANG